MNSVYWQANELYSVPITWFWHYKYKGFKQLSVYTLATNKFIFCPLINFGNHKGKMYESYHHMIYVQCNMDTNASKLVSSLSRVITSVVKKTYCLVMYFIASFVSWIVSFEFDMVTNNFTNELKCIALTNSRTFCVFFCFSCSLTSVALEILQMGIDIRKFDFMNKPSDEVCWRLLCYTVLLHVRTGQNYVRHVCTCARQAKRWMKSVQMGSSRAARPVILSVTVLC